MDPNRSQRDGQSAYDFVQPLAEANSGSLHVELPAETEVRQQTEARLCRREFAVMSWTFGVNHATVTTPIIFASSVLTNTNGQAGNAVLYGATLVCSLFFSSLLFGVFGAKKGLTIAMGLYGVYVLLFGVSAQMCTEFVKGKCTEGNAFQLPLVLIGSSIGGLGAGLLWTSQGAFFGTVCERVAAAEEKETPAVTAELAGTFAFIFLLCECSVRALSTVLTKYAHLSYAEVFFIFAGLAFLSTGVFAAVATDLKKPAPRGSMFGKTLDAIKLWSDPKLWLLQSTNLTFGFAAAYLGGYVGRNILSTALSPSFIGFAGALLSGFAAILAKGLAPMAKKCGKGPVVLIGSVAFLLLGILSRWVGTPADWGWGTLVFYLVMGVGRAVYESTNKAIFADFFPGEKSAGAFANVFVFGTGASMATYVLGAAKQDTAELYLLLAFAVTTFPAFLLASMLKGSAAREAG